MENPEVVIVSASRKHSHQMRLSYQNFCKTRNWFARIKWIILGSPEPIFKSLDERFEGLNLPIVFDNSTLLTENI